MKTYLNPMALVAVMAVCGLSGCQSDDEPAPDNTLQPITLSQSESRALEMQNNFTFRLFEVVRGEGNCILSPLSASVGLSMLANGAEGETLDELTAAIGGGCTLAELNDLNRELLCRLPTIDRKSTLSIASSLWVDDEVSVLPAFVSTLSSVYGSALYSADLQSVSSVNEINGWVTRCTGGHVPKLVSAPLQSSLALLNAVYFRGEWRTGFTPESTREGVFNNIDGTTSTVSMMESDREAPSAQTAYCSGTKMEGADLYYGNTAYCMRVLLPREGVSIDECMAQLASEGPGALSVTDERVGLLRMPRFSIDSSCSLKSLLPRLGVKRIFTPEAEFGNLSVTPLMVDKVLQRATIAVDEYGTVATASTVITGAPTAAPTLNYHPLTFDRPFLFYIYETTSGAVIFMGQVTAF